MYINDFGVKEVNAYYDRKGGMRTANINNYANVGSFANVMRQAAAQRSAGVTSEENPSSQTNDMTRTRSAQAGSTNTGMRTKLQSNSATGVSSTSYGTSHTAQGATAAHTHSTSGKNAADSAADALTSAQGNGNVCCEQCHQTNQLMLQMMTKNLYTQSALGYPLTSMTGMNAWNAYQSVAGMLGGSLFT